MLISPSAGILKQDFTWIFFPYSLSHTNVTIIYFIFIILSFTGKRQYSHDFMQQLRFCPAACVRPVDLQLIPGVTDNTPGIGVNLRESSAFL